MVLMPMIVEGKEEYDLSFDSPTLWCFGGGVVVVAVVGICVNTPPRMCDGGVLEVVLLLLSLWWTSV